MAALRLGIEKCVLPKANEKDLPELPEQVRKGMELVFVDHIDEVLEHTLTAIPGAKGKKKAKAPVRRRSGAPARA